MDTKKYQIFSYADIVDFVIKEVLSYFTIGELDEAYQKYGKVAVIKDGELVDII